MKRLAPAFLLLALACARTEPGVFGPNEAGLILIYENPSLPEAQRTEQRQQLRVEASKAAEEGLMVRRSYSSLSSPPMDLVTFHRDGGTALVRPDGSARLQVLPEGFPDRVRSWEVQGTRYRVLGRAEARLPLTLPAEQRLGVWVEAAPAKGPRTRVLYLPGLGEVESLVQEGAGWICVNRLVSRGFADAPIRR